MRDPNFHLRETHNLAGAKERIVSWTSSKTMVATGLALVGESDVGTNFRMARLRPPVSHLLVTWGGRGRVWLNTQWHWCEPGTAYLMPPGARHAFHTVGRQRWQFSWAFHVATGGAPLVAAEAPLLIPFDPSQIKSATAGLCNEVAGRAEPAVIDRWADLLNVSLRRLTDPLHSHDPLWQVWRAVEREPGAAWSVARLAGMAVTSEESLRRLSAKSIGRSPMQQVTRLRMQRAATMLVSMPLKIAAIAAAVGYTNAFAFSTSFRRHMGCTPMEWRSRSSVPQVAE